jgi:hypothetical protein
MAESIVSENPITRLDKRLLQQRIAEQNRIMGFVPEPGATAKKAREMMLRLGIRPEDNLGSCGIIAAREE